MGENTIQAKSNDATTTMTNTRPRVVRVTNQVTNQTNTSKSAEQDQFVQNNNDENRVPNDKEMSQVVDGDNPANKKQVTESSNANNQGLTPQQHRVVKGDTVWTLLRKRGFSNQEIPVRPGRNGQAEQTEESQPHPARRHPDFP